MCSVDLCDKAVHAKGLCQPHYRQDLRRNRGLKKPGPKPDPGLWRSRYNPDNPHRSRPKKPRRTHCKNGHEYTEENTWRGSNGKRHCRACQRTRAAEWRAANLPNVGNYNSRKTHCVSGHPFDEENTFYTKNNRRGCRECARRNAYIMRVRKYGLTIEQYEQMLEEQNKRCRICAKEFRSEPHIDHDHATGAVRALLCSECNTGLGLFRDDPELLLAAANYVREFSPAV
jgi:hypothetical protein